LAGGDPEAAAVLLGDRWLEIVIAGDSSMLADLLALFPEQAVRDHAELALARAFGEVRGDDVDDALRLTGHAVELEPDLSPPDRLQVAVMAAVIRLYASTMTGRPCDDEYRAAGQLLDRLSEPDLLLSTGDRVRRALLRYNIGAFELSRCRCAAAGDHLSAALDEALALGLPYLELSCRAKLVEYEAQAGRLSRGLEHGRGVLEAAQARAWRSYHGLTAAHVGLAQIAILRDDPETALDHLTQARRMLRPVDRLNRIRIGFLTAAALCAAGKVREAAVEVASLAEAAGDPGELPRWVSTLAAVATAGLAACEGRHEDGLAGLDPIPVPDMPGAAIRPYPALRAELLLRCGRPQEARDALAPALECDHEDPAQVAALVVDALAAAALGLPDAALSALDRALAAAAAERLIQPFVVPGADVRRLLAAVIERGTAQEPFAVEILAHMVPPPAGANRTSGYAPSFVEPLSRRELEVLRLLQGTQGNAEIAAALCVSVNTLRTHMKSINRKLAVSGRREAVRRARELGIL
jgi:LuxR family maltose regulon positive regulatory protein